MKNFAVVWLFLFVAFAKAQTPLTPEQIKALNTITERDVPKNAPGIATAIISDGQTIYQNYVGYANLSDSLKIDENSRFNIASNGKQFTALAILWLEDQDKLDLDDDIRKYIPDIFSENENKITLRHLLHHTSGVRDVYDLWSLQGITWWQHTYDNDDVIDLLTKQTDLNFQPGTQYLYSNSNYILLAEIVERVSKKTFSAFTEDMFDRLKMPDTAFEQDYRNIQGPVAIPYFNFDTWSAYDWKWNVVGDGNLFTTLPDQIVWEKTLHGGGNPNLPRKLIQKSQQLDSINNFAHYGYGLEHATYKGLPYRFHEGATGAWKATVTRFQKEGLSFITLTNSGKTIPAMQTREMVDVVMEFDDSSQSLLTEPEKVGSYVSEEDILGVYLTPSNFSFEFLKNENGSLVLSRVGRGEVEIVREADNIFHQKYDPAFKQEFARNENGEMQVTVYYTSHDQYSLTKTTADWTNYDFSLLNGTYKNLETGVTIRIQHQDHKSYTVKINDQENSGKLVTPEKLLVNSYVLEPIEEDGEVDFISLSGERLRNVRFERVE